MDLSTALNSETLTEILNDNEALEQLQSHLPAIGGDVQEQLRSTIASPQFQQVALPTIERFVFTFCDMYRPSRSFQVH